MSAPPLFFAAVFLLVLPLSAGPVFAQTPEPGEDLKRGDVSTESSPNLGQQKSREEAVSRGEQKPEQSGDRAGAQGSAASSGTRPQPTERPHRFERPLRPERPHR
jgi:hypothetical protein